MDKKVQEHLEKIYSGHTLIEAKDLFVALLTKYNKRKKISYPSEKTTYLITYGDAFFKQGERPLVTLQRVLDEKLPMISDVHILPMFPYTSDDGFSVTDYLQVNPSLGSWTDISQLARDRQLMFDFVCNHISKASKWFQDYLAGHPDYHNAFIEYNDNFDTSNTIRPRISPLFHEFETSTGEHKKVWTTFSEDQIDTNVRDPKMLARLTGVLLEYIARGATSIRLDAVGFLWKKSGTTSMHLEETHEIIKLWRTIVNLYAPGVQIITETNVPHQENVSYFGNGMDEANMVYQFPLPPLVLHTFISEDSTKLTQWAKGIKRVSETATYFNFLASHDGIGLRPVEGILTEEECQQIVDKVTQCGGCVSYKKNTDGTESIYELNISYASALGTVEKMLAAHAILFSLIGVPAIYYHSIFGSQNDKKGMVESGINRRINRQKLDVDDLYRELSTNPFRQLIHEGIKKLILARRREPALNPYGVQEILELGKEVFGVKRMYDGQELVALVNITEHPVLLPFQGIDVIQNREFTGQLNAYQYVWLRI